MISANCKQFISGLAFLLMLQSCGGGGSSSGNTAGIGGGTVSNPASAPGTVVYSSNPAVYTKDVQITENSPTVSGGVATSFTISPALPAGLSLNAANGMITGTPTLVTPATTYIVTSASSAGSATVSISIATLAPANPLAKLGLARESYGVWDRTGYNTVTQYPFTRGQDYSDTWSHVNGVASGTFDWSFLDAQLQFADSQHEQINVQISPIGGALGGSMPTWMPHLSDYLSCNFLN
ncbi:Ig domain-containing protein [Sapientia aquatica]|uniref:Dystroglycan-type cadherin-like domain-containing protein n=1 Tax=Sapientia aquatica TaxID=1549640 RepID=A0A4R5VRP3_9BURK|nr:hypothetical protein E2I14_18125 [Sapientia aquatica]